MYSSEDQGAPWLQAQTGSLVNVLKKILVTGYGTKPPAGWSADFSSSNGSGSTFRPPSGSRMYLSVDDNASGSVRNARLTGFEIATSYNSGSGKFPTTDRGQPNFVICRKSSTTDLTRRQWVCFADAYTVYFRSLTYDFFGYYAGGFSFGDFYTSSVTPDYFNCMLHGHEVTDTDAIATEFLSAYVINMNNQLGFYGCFAPRNYAGGNNGSCRMNKVTQTAPFTTTQTYLSTTQIWPNPADNATWVCPLTLWEHTGSFTRGRTRGEYFLMAPQNAVGHGRVLSGSGGGLYSGKTLFVVAAINSYIAYEISPTVETN